jgi:predicted dehydrogenase
MKEPLGVAIAGLGGFAGSHHAAILALEQEGRCRLVCTCDPDPGGQQTQVEKFHLRERQVPIYNDYSAMLETEADRIDVVLLPTPIPLHAEQHAAAVALGKPCYLEKPPTLWWPEYLQMLETEKQATLSAQIGFNFVGDPLRNKIKSRMLSGEFGRVEGATLLCIWPRHAAYYERNNWAGKMSLNGQEVRDSCIGNALAHYVQDILFWCGSPHVHSIADVDKVRAKLFRAHAIESFDTAFVEATLSDGRWLRIGATHASSEVTRDRQVVYCAEATITFDSWHDARIERSDGSVEQARSEVENGGTLLQENIRAYFDYVKGESARPVTTLEDCRSFVALHNLAFLSSGQVERFDPQRISASPVQGQLSVAGLEDELTAFVGDGRWPVLSKESATVDVARLEDLLG